MKWGPSLVFGVKIRLLDFFYLFFVFHASTEKYERTKAKSKLAVWL